MSKKELFFVLFGGSAALIAGIVLFVYALTNVPLGEPPQQTTYGTNKGNNQFGQGANNTVNMESMTSLEKGERLFSMNCVACHGQGGTGKVGLAPSIRNKDFLAVASDDFIKKTIHNGRPGTSMIARPDLSEQQMDDIIVYLRALEMPLFATIKVDPKKKYEGNFEHGKENFSAYCAACHGTNGEGYVAGGSGPGIGKKGFLDVASDDFIFQTVKNGRVGTAMRSFWGAGGLANLNEQDIADIIVFLRKQK